MLWLVALLCAGMFGLGWWVSRPVGWLARWTFRLAVLVALLSLALPPAGIDWLREVFSALVPLAREASSLPAASYLVHFCLFASVSAMLFWTRPDLGRRYPLLAMACMAFITEGLQMLIDGRFASWSDVVVNLLGIAVAAAGVWSMRRERPAGA